MDRTKAWLVDFRIGYRCKAMMQVQAQKAKEDEELIKRKIPTFSEARKWTATEYRDNESRSGDGGEDGQS